MKYHVAPMTSHSPRLPPLALWPHLLILFPQCHCLHLTYKCIFHKDFSSLIFTSLLWLLLALIISFSFMVLHAIYLFTISQVLALAKIPFWTPDFKSDWDFWQLCLNLIWIKPDSNNSTTFVLLSFLSWGSHYPKVEHIRSIGVLLVYFSSVPI